MKYLALVLLVACSTDKLPDDAQTKECQKLFVHLAQVTGSAADAPAVAASLPFEDYEGCRKSEPEIRTCMMTAADTAAVKKCLPSDDVLACMNRAKAVPEVRALCWKGDAHAADQIKATE